MSGQSKVDKNRHFGFGYGISLNNVYEHVSNATFTYKFSPTIITTYVDFKVDDYWNLIAEIDYIHKGSKNFDINYLGISVLPKYKLTPEGNFSFLVGPYLAYMFRYKAGGDIIMARKKYDTGIDGGLELILDLKDGTTLFISPRIEVGLIRFSLSKHISYQLKTGMRF